MLSLLHSPFKTNLKKKTGKTAKIQVTSDENTRECVFILSLTQLGLLHMEPYSAMGQLIPFGDKLWDSVV